MTVTPPVTLDELKKHLNRPAGAADEDAELTLHLEAATEAIEQRVGPIVNREVTERARLSGDLLELNERPAVSLTTITNVVNGTPTAITGLLLDELDVDLEAGLVNLGHVRGATSLYEVTYTAGRGVIADIPARFKLAVLIVAEHLWQTQRGNGAPPRMFGVSPETSTSSSNAADYIYRGFALPRRALELIANDQTTAIA